MDQGFIQRHPLINIAMAVLVVLAGVAALIQAGPTAAAGEKIVSQYYFYVPPRDGTSVSSMAKAGAVILTNDKYRDQLRAAGFDGEAWQYINANEVEGPGPYSNSSSWCDTDYQSFGNNVAHKQGDFCRYLHKNESWFLHNGKGQRLYTRSNGRVYYHMNPANSGWRQFAGDRMQEQVISRGYDGIYLDNVELSRYKVLHQLPNSDGTLKEFSSDTAYRSAWVGHLAHLSSKVRSHGQLVGNMIADWNDGSTWNAYLQYLDGGMYEAFAAGYSGESWNVTKWGNHLKQAEWALANGKTVMALAQGSKSDYSRQAFTLASYLLITDGQRAHYRYGHYNDYDQWWQYSNYDVELGQPTGKRYQQSDGTWKRDFQCGSVVVNPSRRTGSISESSCKSGSPAPSLPSIDPPEIGRVALPGKIEAENYKEGGFYDRTPGNTGGAYRNDDVDIQTTNDSGGGHNVGWVESGESLTYDVSVVTSGNYEFTLRIASPQNGKKVRVEVDGQNVTGSITVPNSGGYERWTNLTSKSVYIGSGNHTVKVVAETDGFNLNYVDVKQVSGGSTSSTPEIQRVALPGKIEAENYKAGAFYDRTPGNTGGAYRNDDVDIQTTNDSGGGHNVGWIESSESLTYDVSVSSGANYEFVLRVASPQDGKKVRVEVNGQNVTGSITVPNSGGYERWTNVTSTPVWIGAGNHTVKVVAETDGFNLNYIDVRQTSTGSSTSTPEIGRVALPGKVEAENYKEGGFYDTTSGNTGGEYRNDDVDIQTTNDSGSGHNVGWVESGESLTYDVSVASSGNYEFTLRVASPQNGKKVRIEVNGQNVTGTITVPNSGGYDRWTNVTSKSVYIGSGNHTMKIVAETDGFNLNYVDVKQVSSGSSGSGSEVERVALPGKIEAEDYKAGGFYDTTRGNNGGVYREDDVDIQGSWDAGGGFNVGWIESGEWLEYDVSVPSGGNYEFVLRIASNQDGKKMRVEVNGQNVTGSITVPNTGGHQLWNNAISKSVWIGAGNHTIKVVAETDGINLNYIDVRNR